MPKVEREKDLPGPETRVAKYHMAVRSGMTKAKAAEVAGYSCPNQTTVIEKSKGFQKLQEYYKDELLKRVSLGQIADEHAKVIVQDNEMGPKLAAIKIAMDKIEPPDKDLGDDDDRVFVVLK